MASIMKRVLSLWSHRELVWALTLKEWKARYKSARLGFAWALLNPLVMMVVLSIVFSYFFRLDPEKFPDIAPFPVFLLVALLPWTFFMLSLTSATTSFRDNNDLLKKVYFPREIVPLSIILANLINFCLSLPVLAPLLIYCASPVGWSLLALPVAVVLLVLLTVALSLFTSAMCVTFRDVEYIVQALMLPLFYLTPIFYSPSLLTGEWAQWRWLFYLNPVADAIFLFRFALLPTSVTPASFDPWLAGAAGFGLTGVALVIGCWAFYRKDRLIADFV
jgi:homopolymeric O-antigen transport system permease protein